MEGRTVAVRHAAKQADVSGGVGEPSGSGLSHRNPLVAPLFVLFFMAWFAKSATWPATLAAVLASIAAAGVLWVMPLSRATGIPNPRCHTIVSLIRFTQASTQGTSFMVRPLLLPPAAMVAIFVSCFVPSSVAATDLELLSVEKIWDAAPHNAFTDLVRFDGKWVCGFREAPAHGGGVKDSRIRVIASQNGKQWQSVATISDEPRGDIRDAKFGLLPDGRLMLLTATQFFDTSTQKHQSHSWITSDLENWDGPHDVGDPDIWTWDINFHKGTGYSIGYRTADPRFARLYTTQDGTEFQTRVKDLAVESSYPNESAIVFDKQGSTAYCLLRCSGPAQFGTAEPPYTDWTWKVMNAPVGGPEMIRLPDGRLLGGGRLYDGRQRTSLFWIDPESAKLTEALTLPSGGDTSYPGFVLHDGILHVSYYASHEGKSSIYFARVQINDAKSDAIEIGNRLEPFVDDHLIDSFFGESERRLHKPADRGVVIAHDAPWEGNTSTYHTVFGISRRRCRKISSTGPHRSGSNTPARRTSICIPTRS